jgi:flagellar basal body-associated protein FliL
MEDEAENPEAQEATESEESSVASGGSGSIVWLAMLVAAAVISSVGGFVLARSMGAGASPQTQPAQAEPPIGTESTLTAGGDFAYYHFEPITVNLAGDNMSRYIRATITLAIEAKDAKEATKRIETKKPELKNWMTVFLADCTLERVRGAKALNRLRREIKDSFNEQLWPDQSPLVQDVLFKEFFIQ